ncbi:MAG: four helix bundle protein [Saprospiraceae bacterium]|nr:four helix bundle protein [Saprospiraceae bacterium]
MKKKIYKQFEDLIVWQEGMELCINLNKALWDSKQYAIKDQITRSAISIPSHIAEGFERQSDKEFVKFLYYAKGPSGELRTQLYIASQPLIIETNICDEAIARSRRISGMIQNLITTIKHDI